MGCNHAYLRKSKPWRIARRVPQRFLIAEGDIPKLGQTLHASTERAHYLTRVLRHRQGDALSCFNGHGLAFECMIRTIGKRGVELEVTDIAPQVHMPAHASHMMLALIKGSAMDRAIQQCVELGATHITLFGAERSNVTLSDERLANKRAHWAKVIAGACEQCGQLTLPPLEVGQIQIAQIVDRYTPSLIVLDQAGSPLSQEDINDIARQPLRLAVGPEGGWSDSERSLFSQRRVPMRSLGTLTLRAETIPSAALAIVHYLRTL